MHFKCCNETVDRCSCSCFYVWEWVLALVCVICAIISKPTWHTCTYTCNIIVDVFVYSIDNLSFFSSSSSCGITCCRYWTNSTDDHCMYSKWFLCFICEWCHKCPTRKTNKQTNKQTTIYRLSVSILVWYLHFVCNYNLFLVRCCN